MGGFVHMFWLGLSTEKSGNDSCRLLSSAVVCVCRIETHHETEMPWENMFLFWCVFAQLSYLFDQFSSQFRDELCHRLGRLTQGGFDPTSRIGVLPAAMAAASHRCWPKLCGSGLWSALPASRQLTCVSPSIEMLLSHRRNPDSRTQLQREIPGSSGNYLLASFMPFFFVSSVGYLPTFEADMNDLGSCPTVASISATNTSNGHVV